MVSCTQEMLFVKNLVECVGLVVKLPMIMFGENKSAIYLANHWSIGGRTRHVDVCLLFLRDLKQLKVLLAGTMSFHRHKSVVLRSCGACKIRSDVFQIPWRSLPKSDDVTNNVNLLINSRFKGFQSLCSSLEARNLSYPFSGRADYILPLSYFHLVIELISSSHYLQLLVVTHTHMPVITRAKSLRNMFSGPTTPQPDVPGTDPQSAQHVATNTSGPQPIHLMAPTIPPSPLERLLECFEAFLSRVNGHPSPSLPATTSNPYFPTPTPPSYPTPPPPSLPGHDLDADGGDGSGGRILGSIQGYRASPPIVGAPASGQPEVGVSHSPTRLPWCPDTAQAIARSSSLHDQCLSSSSPIPSSNISSIPQVRVQVQNLLTPGDDPSENFTPQGGIRWENFSSANTDSTGVTTHGRAVATMSTSTQGRLQNVLPTLPPITPLERAEKIKFPAYSGDTSTYEDGETLAYLSSARVSFAISTTLLMTTLSPILAHRMTP